MKYENPQQNKTPYTSVITNDSIIISPSALEAFTKCPRMFQYEWLERYQQDEGKAALTFGSAIHAAMKLLYLLPPSTPPDVKTLRVHHLLQEVWKVAPTPIGDYRTCELAKDVMGEYIDQYKDRDFPISSVVENTFIVPLGQIGQRNVFLRGKLDLTTRLTDNLWGVDHKTSSVGGDLLMPQYYCSSQFKAYTYALNKLFPKDKVQGIIVNVLIVRKPSKTGKGTEFLRIPLEYPSDVLEEWVSNTMYIAQLMLHNYHVGTFPQHTSQCIHRFGRCSFYDICTLPRKARQPLLTSTFKVGSMLDESEEPVDVSSFVQLPIDEVQEKVSQHKPTILNPLQDIYDTLV